MLIILTRIIAEQSKEWLYTFNFTFGDKFPKVEQNLMGNQISHKYHIKLDATL